MSGGVPIVLPCSWRSRICISNPTEYVWRNILLVTTVWVEPGTPFAANGSPAVTACPRLNSTAALLEPSSIVASWLWDITTGAGLRLSASHLGCRGNVVMSLNNSVYILLLCCQPYLGASCTYWRRRPSSGRTPLLCSRTRLSQHSRRCRAPGVDRIDC